MPVLLAVIAALAYGSASILQALGARQTAVEGHGIGRVLQQRTYLTGLLVDLVGWFLSLLALRSLPLFEVQAILAGSVAVTALLAAIVMHAALRRIDTAAIVTVLAALVVIGLAAGNEGVLRVHRAGRAALELGVPVAIIAAVLSMHRARPVVMGLLAGLVFSGSALCARLVHVPRHHAWHVLIQPLAWCVVAYGATAMLLYAKALSKGHVGAVTAAMWVANVVAPSVIGVAFLHDHVRSGWEVPAVLAMLVALGATAVLARSPAQPTA